MTRHVRSSLNLDINRPSYPLYIKFPSIQATTTYESSVDGHAYVCEEQDLGTRESRGERKEMDIVVVVVVIKERRCLSVRL